MLRTTQRIVYVASHASCRVLYLMDHPSILIYYIPLQSILPVCTVTVYRTVATLNCPKWSERSERPAARAAVRAAQVARYL
jgi:hypothetical protein